MSAGQGSHPSAPPPGGSWVSAYVLVTADAVFAFEEPTNRPPSLRLLFDPAAPGAVVLTPVDADAAEQLHAATGRLLDIVRSREAAGAAAPGPQDAPLRVVRP
ncbi:MAG: hypothetical protein ACJ74O_13720 [Frankiaceae bacterium]|jgi:hypothetical protein